MRGILFLITPATIWSPIYPTLWMCLVRDSGLFIFLTQILIWSYAAAFLFQLYSAWIQDKELHSHTHTHTSIQYPVFYSSGALQPVWPFSADSCPTNDMSDTPFLAVSWQPHCLQPHIRAAGSVMSLFNMPLSPRTVSSPSLVLS